MKKLLSICGLVLFCGWNSFSADTFQADTIPGSTARPALTNFVDDADSAPREATQPLQANALARQLALEQEAVKTFIATNSTTPPEQLSPDQPISSSNVAIQPALPQEIQITDAGALAEFGPHKVLLAPSPDTEDAVSIQIPSREGLQNFKSHVVGIGFWDIDSGHTVLFAQPKACAGQVQGTTVLYPNAFDGIDADLSYVYSGPPNIASFEQNVILRQRIPDPSAFSLTNAPARIRLVVISEMTALPNVIRVTNTIDLSSHNLSLGVSSETNLIDETLYIGSMRMPEGRSVLLGTNSVDVPSGKTLIQADGHWLLIEYTPWPLIKALIDSLPSGTLHAQFKRADNFEALLAQISRRKIDGKSDKSAKVSNPRLSRGLASAQDNRPGVLLDYILTSSRLLNVDFGGANPPKQGIAAVGQFATDVWKNWFYPSSSHTEVNLPWSDNAASPVTVTLQNGTGAWANDSTDPMYNSYVYPGMGGTLTVTITGLPTDNYNFYLYGHEGHADNPRANAKFQLWRAGNQIGYKGTTLWGTAFATTNWEAGQQYQLFTNVSVNNQQIQIIIPPGGDGYAYLNGMQIVPSAAVPPSSPTISKLININVGDNSTKVGQAAVGVSASDVWNTYWDPSQNASFSMENLRDSSGAETGVGMVIQNAQVPANNGVADAMYGGYTHPSLNGNSALILTNLQAGNYDLYLYGHAGSDNANCIFEVWSGTRPWGKRGTSIWGSEWNSLQWNESQQFVVFHDVWVEPGQAVTILANPGDTGVASFNGLQIVCKGAADSNGNNLPDAWETYYFGSVGAQPEDPDGDWLKNRREYELGFNPKKANTDFTSLNDWQKSDIPWLTSQAYAGGNANGQGNSDMWSATVDAWNWTSQANWSGTTISSQFGNQIHISDIHTGTHLHWFEKATNHFMVKTGDVLYAWVYLDPQNVPAEIMLQWQSAGDQNYPSWEHRAYWGANNVNWGVSGTPSRYHKSGFFIPGSWVQLNVPAAAVGLEGKIVQGLAFVISGGRVAWDKAGIFTPDMDGNGLPDAWEIANFTHIGIDPYDDPENDGLNNLQEYQAGSDPHIRRPDISQQPIDATRLEGEGVTFSVVASGQAPISYVWRKDGTIVVNDVHVSGATTATLTFSSLSAADAGVYTVDVINPGGTRTSSPAVLRVCPAFLSVNAYKRSSEDKFYFDVYNLSMVDLQGGSFKLLVYFVTETGTYYATLLPWGTSDVLIHGGGHHLFTMCNSDHSITNYYCAILYDNGTTCLSSPKFQIAAKTDIARYYVNTTQIPNPCLECPPPNNCVGDNPPLFVPPIRRLVCREYPEEDRVRNCQPEVCGPFLQPLPISSSVDGASMEQDNFYLRGWRLTDNVDVTGPKHGFKNVYAIKQWHGAFGPKSDVPQPTLSAMSGDTACQTWHKPIDNPDTAKYLKTESWGDYQHHYWYHSGPHGELEDHPAYGTVTRTSTIDKQTGKNTYGGDNIGPIGPVDEASTAVPAVRIADLPGVYIKQLNFILPSLKGLPAPPLPDGSGGSYDIQPQFTAEGPVPSVTWNYEWDFTLPGTDCTSITKKGHYNGFVTLDLAAGTYTSHSDKYEEVTVVCPPPLGTGTSWNASSANESFLMSDARVDYHRDTSNTSSGGDEDVTSVYNGYVNYLIPYKSDDVNSDVDGLLAKWNLLDDFEYPWRTDGGISSGPLVTYNERSATPPTAMFALNNLNVEPGGDPVWEVPIDDSLPPWPSQSDGAILGKPLPVHGSDGELRSYAPYFNFYHKNWKYYETERGSPAGYIESYGAASPYTNATQWTDKDLAKCLPSGPFWAYGSEIEADDHFMFRFKNPDITDTENEWEQGGYGGGCLIKCKWAETISPVAPQGEDFVFKQWQFNFRDFISSYYYNVGAWIRNSGGSTCPALSFIDPVRYIPINIPYPLPFAGYYIGPGSYWLSNMTCSPVPAGKDCCQTAVYVQPNPVPKCDNLASNGVFIEMPSAVCDARFGSLWMGRVDQTTPDSGACNNYVANRNNGVANPDACDPQIELDPVFHSHNHAYELFVAPLPPPDGSQTTLDLDIDSDNNNAYNAPVRSAFEDQIEDDKFRPGKLVWVNTGDYDLDGVPDYADGFNWDGVTGNEDDANTPKEGEPNNRFVPIVLQVGNGVNLALARLRITYTASDPAGVTHNGNPPVWQPAPDSSPGSIRIWKKNADQSRNKNSAKAGTPGDFVEPGVYGLSQLGIVPGNRTVTLYVEGIQVSEKVADQRILVELDPDGDGPEGWNIADAVRVSVIGGEFVKATGDKTVQPVSVLSDSHAAPYFDGVWVNPSQPQLDTDGNVLGNITVSGTIRSDLCDLIKGDAGKLGDILVSLNGDPLTADGSSVITVHKSDGDPDHPSFTHPFATSTEFTLVFNNVELSTGTNWLRLAVTDSVPGSGLTGFAEYAWEVTATQIVLPEPNPGEPNPPTASPDPNWTLQNSVVIECSKNGRGEINNYLIRLRGPPFVLRYVSEIMPSIIQGPDGNFYVAADPNTPEFHILMALQKARGLPTPQGPMDFLDEERGFYYGMWAQGVKDIKGLFHVEITTDPTAPNPGNPFSYLRAYEDVGKGTASEAQIRFVVDVGTDAEHLSAAAKTVWNFCKTDLALMQAQASGDWDEAWRLSESRRWIVAYLVEAMVAINNKYVDSTPFERGEMKGRFLLEAEILILPFTKTTQHSKLLLMTKIKEIEWIKNDAKMLEIVTKMADVLNGKKPPPVIPPLIPPGIPEDLLAGEKLGGIAKRVWGRAVAKMIQGTPRRTAFLEAMVEVLPLSGDRNTAKVLQSVVDQILAELPANPTAQDFDKLFRVSDWRYLTTRKRFKVSADGYEVLIPGKGWLRGHHVVEKTMIDYMNTRWGTTLYEGDSPLKVLIEINHWDGPGSLHRKMWFEWNLNAAGVGALDAARFDEFGGPQDLIDELLRFYKANYQELAPAVRGWCVKYGVPFSE